MKSIEMSGKTVEDAVQAGLKELHKDSSQVAIDVLEYGSPGLFGMFGKLARVRLVVRDDDDDFEMPVFSLDQQVEKKPAKPEKKPEPKKPEPRRPEPVQSARPEPSAAERPNPAVSAPQPIFEAQVSEPVSLADAIKAPEAPRADAGERPHRSRRRGPGGNESGQGGEPRQMREPRPVGAPRQDRPRPEARPMEPRRAPEPLSMEDLPPLELDKLSETGVAAYTFLSEMTRLMNVNVEIRLQETEGHLTAQMIGDTLGVLIGRRGETLDALQYLTSLQLNKGREEYLRVTLDTEHYRAKREDALIRLADRMANRARKTGHRVALEPMNPYERRVLHASLQDHPYVTTHSEGEEPYRRVIITLK